MKDRSTSKALRTWKETLCERMPKLCARMLAVRARLSVIGRELNLTFKAFRTSKLSMSGLVIILAMVAIALFAPVISPEHPVYVLVQGAFQQRWPENLNIALLAPSLSHLFGTNQYGADVFSKVIYGARIDLTLPVEAIVLSAIIGIVIGGVAGFFEGRMGQVLMRITDAFLAIPSIVLALVLVAALGPSLVHIEYAIIATWWSWYARLTYGETRKMKHRDFVEVARSSGLSGTSIFFRHVLKNVLAPSIIQATSDLGNLLLTIAGLSFLGLGASPGTAEWGLMISNSESYIYTAWWLALFPGVFLIVTVIGFNLLGDGLRDVFDPTSRRWLSQEDKGAEEEVEHAESYSGASPETLLNVDNLSITYMTYEGPLKAVRNVSFKLNRSEAYGLIGESGSGKSTIASAIMGLSPKESTRISSGDIFLNLASDSDKGPVNLLTMKENEINAIRGREMGIIFQEISDSLHPSYKVGFQIGQTYLLHQFEMLLDIVVNVVANSYGVRPCTSCGKEVPEGEWICDSCYTVVPPSEHFDFMHTKEFPDGLEPGQRREINKYRELHRYYTKRNLGPDRTSDRKINEVLKKLVMRDMRRVMIPDPNRTFDLYPFELSGGMKQRSMIAMMMSSNPKLLIADEPTTALDVVSERSTLDLIRKIKLERNLSILFISHDLNVIKRICDRIGVLYAGKLLEQGSLSQIFEHASHPYTRGLIQTLPKVQANGEYVQRGDILVIEGTVPELRVVPTGCVFADRCNRVAEKCRVEDPQLIEDEEGHSVACFYPVEEAMYNE